MCGKPEMPTNPLRRPYKHQSGSAPGGYFILPIVVLLAGCFLGFVLPFVNIYAGMAISFLYEGVSWPLSWEDYDQSSIFWVIFKLLIWLLYLIGFIVSYLLVVVSCGAAVGAVAATAVKRTKCALPVWIGFWSITAVLGAIAIHCVHSLENNSLPSISGFPEAADMSRTVQTVILCIESALLLVIAAVFSISAAVSAPFCPNCRCWFEATDLGNYSTDNASPLARAVRSNNYEKLPRELERTRRSPYIDVTIFSCPSCDVYCEVLRVYLHWEEEAAASHETASPESELWINDYLSDEQASGIRQALRRERAERKSVLESKPSPKETTQQPSQAQNAAQHSTCAMAKTGGCVPVAWYLPELGQYACDEHKEVFEAGLRLKGHSPNWQRVAPVPSDSDFANKTQGQSPLMATFGEIAENFSIELRMAILKDRISRVRGGLEGTDWYAVNEVAGAINAMRSELDVLTNPDSNSPLSDEEKEAVVGMVADSISVSRSTLLAIFRDVSGRNLLVVDQIEEVVDSARGHQLE